MSVVFLYFSDITSKNRGRNPSWYRTKGRGGGPCKNIEHARERVEKWRMEGREEKVRVDREKIKGRKVTDGRSRSDDTATDNSPLGAVLTWTSLHRMQRISYGIPFINKP